MNETLSQNSEVHDVYQDDWGMALAQDGVKLETSGNSCVVTIIHFPGKVTFMGHYSTPDTVLQDARFSNTEVKKSLASMHETIKAILDQGKVSTADAKAYVLAGSGTSKLPKDEKDELDGQIDQAAQYHFGLIKQLGLNDDQVSTRRLVDDVDFVISVDPINGDVTQSLSPTKADE